MQINLKVVYKDPKQLTPNSINSEIFGDLSGSEGYIELKTSIALSGILQPLIITKLDRVRSGDQRLKCALELGLKSIPCIVENDIDVPTVASLDNEVHEKYRTIVHDLKKKDTVYSKLIRLEILNQIYNIKQGVRTDKNPKLAAYIKERNSLGSQTERTKLSTIRKHLEKAFPEDGEAQNNWLKNQGEKSRLKTVSRDAKRLAVENNENNGEGSNQPNLRFEVDEEQIRIFNQSCFDLSQIPDDSIQNIVTSPPYYKMRPPQQAVETTEEVGTETDIELYTDRLVECFTNCKRVLKQDGTIWVNISDKMMDGCFQLAPELFMLKMLSAGFLCTDKIFWVKSNAQPGDGNNTFQNVEYLLKFSLSADPYTNYDWLNTTTHFEDSKFGKGARIKLSSFVHLKESFVTTCAANTGRLRKACEKEGFYLEHNTTFPPEIPYLCIRLSSRETSAVLDIFNGCGNTAKAVLHAKDLNLKYYGYEINPLSVRASKVNIDMDFKDKSTANASDPATGTKAA